MTEVLEIVNVADELPPRPLTLDDVNRLAVRDDQHRFELSEGNLIVMPPGTWRHQKIIGLLFAWFLASRYRDRVNIEPGVQTATDSLNGRVPDVVVTTDPVPDRTLWLRPEKVALAIEVVSKGSERTDRFHKPIEYAIVGIPRYWRVETDETVLQFELRDQIYVQAGLIPLADLLVGEVPDLD